MNDSLFTAQNLISLVSLSLMEIVLGIDNIVFLSILSNKLPPEHRSAARRVGLTMALVLRVGLLGTITWIMKFTRPLLTLGGFELTGRDLILLAGGGFLILKSAHELYEKVTAEVDEDDLPKPAGSRGSYALVMVQIAVFDLIFSLDSIITAVGMTGQLPIMIGATLFAVLCMMLFADRVGDFIARHPSIKLLALAFLVLVGVVLVIDAMHLHLSRTPVYVAMAFSLTVELMGIRYRKTKRIPDSAIELEELLAQKRAAGELPAAPAPPGAPPEPPSARTPE